MRCCFGNNVRLIKQKWQVKTCHFCYKVNKILKVKFEKSKF